MQSEEDIDSDPRPPLSDHRSDVDACRVQLNQAQLRALSVRLSSINEHLKLLRELDVDDPLLESLERGIAQLARTTGATISSPQRQDPAGVLISVLISLDEISPQGITAYGPLNADARDYLDPTIVELYEQASDLQRRLQALKRENLRPHQPPVSS